jgi:hypothetical protein
MKRKVPEVVMGKFVLFAVMVTALVAGCFFYISDTADGFSMTPSFMLTEEETQLRALETEFAATKKKLAQSNRMAAVAGIDTSSDIESARARARELEAELKELELPAGRGSAKAAELLGAIQKFSSDLS